MTERKVASKTFGRYIILHTIGKGEFGKVKLAYDPEKDIEVAIKFIKRSNITSAQKQAKLEREINILQNLDHPNIVRLYDVIETEKYIGIVMAYANGGELFEYISENQYLSEEESAKFFIQLLDGVQYLHSRHIVHRDLKLENLLLDQKGDIIITDFGFANNSRKNPTGLLSTSCGSPCYAAPELVINDNYIGEAADIWSCGIILYAMLCGYLPFDDDPNNPDGENLDLLYKYILESQLTFPDYVSEDAQDLVCGMLIPDPEKRWPMEKVINHRWLRNSMYSKERMNESMNMDYIYDNSYLKYINESSNSEIENVQEGKVPDYPPTVPVESKQSPQNGLDEETEVYETRNNNVLAENVDSSMDKTEYVTNQEASKDAVVPDEPKSNDNEEAVVPEIEKQQSISQTSSEQEFLDAQQELTMEVTKDQDDQMDVENTQEDKMDLDESPSQVSPALQEQANIEVERENAEKQIEKLINEIQQEEFTQLEEMKDQLQEVVAENAENAEVVTEKVDEVKEEVAAVSETPAETTEKVKEEASVEEVKEIEENVEKVKEEVEEVNKEVTDSETIEEVKEKVAVIPETSNENVEEVKEEVATVSEPDKENVDKVKEEINDVLDTTNEKDEVKESEVTVEEKIETPVEEKLEKDLIEVDEVKSQGSSSSTSITSSESEKNDDDKTIENKEEIKESTEEVEQVPENVENVNEDVEMKEHDSSKESEITTIEEDEVNILKKRKQKKTKKDNKMKKRRKGIKKNEKAKNKKNFKNKMFKVFFGCFMKDPATKEI